MHTFDFNKMTISGDHIIRLNKCQADAIKYPNAAGRTKLWSDLHDFEFDVTKGIYIPLGDKVELTNKIQDKFGKVPSPPAEGLEDAFPYRYFCNALLIPQKEAANAKPLMRLTNAGFIYITHEIDSEAVEQVDEIGNWFAGDPEEKTLFYQVHVALKRYMDYRGYCVVFSGRRSFHIHLKFDTKHLLNAPHNETFEQRLVGFQEKAMVLSRAAGIVWDATGEVITDLLNPPIAGDRKMRSAVQWRPAPFALRRIETKPIFGLEVGDCVPQLVIRKSISGRKYPGATQYLSDKNLSASHSIGRANSGRRKSSGPCEAFPALSNCEALVEAINSHCAETWASDYPRLMRIDQVQGDFVLNFANRSTDKNPSTLVRGDFGQLILQGKHEFAERSFWLPDNFSANEIVAFWSSYVGVKAIEMQFSSAKSKDALKQVGRDNDKSAILRTMNHVICGEPLKNALLIQGCPGGGKSTTVFTLVEELFSIEFPWECESSVLRVVLFCSTSRKQAANKLAEFKTITNGCGQGVLIEGFTTVYMTMCEELGIESIEDHFEGETPYDVWQIIANEQPQVANALIERHRNMWAGIDREKIVVVFTSFATLYHWEYTGKTKVFNHINFGCSVDNISTNALANKYRVVACILDDYSAQDLLIQMPAKIINKIAELQSEYANWRNMSRFDKRGAFNTYGNALECESFDEFDGKMRLNLNDFTRLSVDFDAISFGVDNTERGMYRKKNGETFGIAVRDWNAKTHLPKNLPDN